MRQRAQQVCAEHGCNQLTRRARCAEHERQDQKERNSSHTSDPFYSSTKWRKLRSVYIRRHPLCEVCESAGRVVPSKEIHHKQPRQLRPDLELKWSNLQALCPYCHRRETGREQRARRKTA